MAHGDTSSKSSAPSVAAPPLTKNESPTKQSPSIQSSSLNATRGQNMSLAALRKPPLPTIASKDEILVRDQSYAAKPLGEQGMKGEVYGLHESNQAGPSLALKTGHGIENEAKLMREVRGLQSGWSELGNRGRGRHGSPLEAAVRDARNPGGRRPGPLPRPLAAGGGAARAQRAGCGGLSLSWRPVPWHPAFGVLQLPAPNDRGGSAGSARGTRGGGGARDRGRGWRGGPGAGSARQGRRLCTGAAADSGLRRRPIPACPGRFASSWRRGWPRFVGLRSPELIPMRCPRAGTGIRLERGGRDLGPDEELRARLRPLQGSFWGGVPLASLAAARAVRKLTDAGGTTVAVPGCRPPGGRPPDSRASGFCRETKAR